MAVKNNDIDTMIKMENLIGMNEKKLFGRNKDKKLTYTIYGDSVTITHDDFVDFMNLIEKLLQEKKQASEKSNTYNKRNKEYHNITSNMHQAKKSGNQERYEYWHNKLLEYKKNRG